MDWGQRGRGEGGVDGGLDRAEDVAVGMSGLSGILVLDKPAGVGSTRVLNRLKRALPRGTKLGHAGTLDPFATGVLLALVGKSTRLCEACMGLPKVYRATLRLGATTETLDPESPVIAGDGGGGGEAPGREALEAAAAGFVGEVLQAPPAYSAMKVGGRRAYDLAREGKPVELPARRVRCYWVRVTGYSYPDVELEMLVGRGFYVRSLARDLAAAVGTVGYLTALRRSRVGPFAADADCPPLPAVEATAVSPEAVTPENVERLLRAWSPGSGDGGGTGAF